MFLNYDANLLMNLNATNLPSLLLLIRLFGLVSEAIGDYHKNIFYNNKAQHKESAEEASIQTRI